MRFLLSLLVILVVSALAISQAGSFRPGAAPAAASNGDPGEVKALIMVANHYGANYNLIRDVMELYGWDITTVGVTPKVSPCYYGDSITVDTLVTEIADVSYYDVLLISTSRIIQTGGSHAQLLASPEALDLVAQAASESLLVVALCGGPRVLAAAGVINGVTVTGKEEYLQEYLDAGAIWAGESDTPLMDGNFITSLRNQLNSRRLCEMIRTYVAEKRAGAK
ncbi:MAG: DJ-1/PfpI family protein [bacterium]|jgi:putative intracellular protease/amidase